METPRVSNNKKPHSLLFLEIGLFEIGFVILFLGGVLFLLNVFHIISLKQTFPFITLIHQPATTVAPAPQLTSIVLSDSNFTNGILLRNLLQGQIVDRYIYQDASQVQYTTFSKNSRQARWSIGNTIVTLSALNDPNTQKLTNLSIGFTQPSNSLSTTLEATEASKLVNQYVLHVPSSITWTCTNNEKLAQCTASSTTTNTTKYSVDLRHIPEDPKQLFVGYEIQL